MTPPDPQTSARMLALLRPHLRLRSTGTTVGLDDDLGRLGLDSVATMQVLIELESEFGISIPDDLVRVDTLATLRHFCHLLENCGTNVTA